MLSVQSELLDHRLQDAIAFIGREWHNQVPRFYLSTEAARAGHNLWPYVATTMADDDILYLITQGAYQTYRETLDDALEWGRYRAYEHGADVLIASTDGETNITISQDKLSFRMKRGDEENHVRTREEALRQGRELARQGSEEVLVYDYNEKPLAKFVLKGSRLSEEFYPCERIAISRDICMGQPHVMGTRIQVWVILDLLASGWAAEDIVEDYDEDNITVPDVLACLDYASKVLQGITFTSPL